MEPVTHILTGAVLARAGFNRRAAYATAAMAIAAEAPDLDTLWSFGGPLTGFLHHRGITHTFLAIPFEAALITAIFYAAHRARKHPTTKAPANWAWLFAGTLVALLSHLLLDWTNNYGLRPFFPFNPHWYAGSFVFIFEPILFLILVLALIMPALFGLINAEVGVRRTTFRGRPAAIAALIAIAALYLFRFNQHQTAINIARQNTPEATRIFASPHPLNPFTWHMVLDFPDRYQLATLNSRTHETDPAVPADTLIKPANSLALLAAKRTELGRVYLDWSFYPVFTETPDTSDPNHPLTQVTFTDARFIGNMPPFISRDKPPLAGSVLLDMQAAEGERLLETKFDGKPQR